MSRINDLKELNPLVEFLARKAIEDIKSQGVNPLIVETYRSQARQNTLYAQGRTKPGNKVTWTRNSKHTTRKALDVVPQRRVSGKMTAIWNAKDKDFVIIINTMIAYGFEAGHNWTKAVDSPHFQIDGNFTTSFSRDRTTREITKMIQGKVHAKIDGSWGNDTEASVKAFQKLNGLKVNGHVGMETLKAMFEEKPETVNKPRIGEYIVKKGDTLWGISHEYNMTVDELKKLNGLTNDIIHVGDKLRLNSNAKVDVKPEQKKEIQPKATSTGDATIRNIQSTLNSRYNTGIRVDGYYGDLTRRAIVKGLQTELNKQFGKKLQIDGSFGSSSRANWVTVKRGAKGNLTYLIQALLYCKGYKLTLDSLFGGGTEAVVKQFQKANKLTQDGSIGKITISELVK